MSGIASTLRDATARLAGLSETPRLDAELLMAHALGCSRSDLLLRQAELAVPDGFAALLARRIGHEPVAYITGTQAFWDLNLTVTPDALIPRADSETLIEAAIEAFSEREGPARMLDLGTGSGALLLAALSAFPAAVGVGIDASAAALAVAAGNADRLGMSERATFRHLSWKEEGWAEILSNVSPEPVEGPSLSFPPKKKGGTSSLDELRGSGRTEFGFDLILCNPPYVEDTAALAPMVADHEPHSALFAGPDGLDDYRILIPAMPALLSPGGVAIFEIGFTQAQAVHYLATLAGLSTEMRHDLAGNPRALRFSLGIGSGNR
ncbi:MAG: peptide chain release factor N(5)-glutamine methyltransferase [Sphingorhabdus sp.]